MGWFISWLQTKVRIDNQRLTNDAIRSLTVSDVKKGGH